MSEEGSIWRMHYWDAEKWLNQYQGNHMWKYEDIVEKCLLKIKGPKFKLGSYHELQSVDFLDSKRNM